MPPAPDRTARRHQHRPCGRRQHRLDLQAYRLTASRESPYFPLPRHAELVSASMARALVKRGVIFEDRPWTLKQVQGDVEVSMERLRDRKSTRLNSSH